MKNLDSKIKNTTDNNYAFYSKVLGKPFDTLKELTAAETEFYAQNRAKEEATNERRNDAKLVEAAFKDLNTARKSYKEDMTQLTTEYANSLEQLKRAYEHGQKDLHLTLANAEKKYEEALKIFIEKHPEGYHLTLKDGDFETTISSQTEDVNPTVDFSKVAELFNLLFGI